MTLIVVYVCLPQTTQKLPEEVKVVLFSILYYQCLVQGLGHSKMLVEVVSLPMKWPPGVAAALTSSAPVVWLKERLILFIIKALPSPILALTWHK